MRFSLTALTVVASSVAIFAACGGGAPQAKGPAPEASASASVAPSAEPEASATPAPTASASATEVAAPAPPWSDAWSIDQKVAFMKTAIAPKMAPLFKAVDAKKFADFGCETCHGPDKKAPKDFLPHLTMKKGKLTAFTEKPQVSKFMAEKVVPAMAEALGVKPFDPKTHEGFGCAGCHTIDMAK